MHATDGAEVTYGLRHRVLLEDVFGSRTSIQCLFKCDIMQLSPGGRYFFIVLADRHVPRRLQMYDLHDGGRCVWSFLAPYRLRCFDFESRQDGSILVAVVHTISIHSGLPVTPVT